MSSSNKNEKIFYTRNAEIFIESATQCSFSAAAERLKISQSSVSQTIKHMEQSLGFDLFERDRRPLRLTQGATLLLNKFLRERDESMLLIDSIRMQNRLKPPLNLGIIESLASFIGVRLTSQLKSQFSQLSVYTGAFDKLSRALAEGHMDVGIIPVPFDSESLQDSYLLFEEPWLMLFPESYPFDYEDYTWQDMKLCGLPLVQASNESANGHILNEVYEKCHVSFPKVFEVDSHVLSYQFVQGGLGWTVIQGYGPSYLYKMKGIRRLPPPQPLPKRKIYLIVKKGFRKELVAFLYNQTVSIMREELSRNIAPLLPWFVKDFSFKTFDEVSRG